MPIVAADVVLTVGLSFVFACGRFPVWDLEATHCTGGPATGLLGGFAYIHLSRIRLRMQPSNEISIYTYKPCMLCKRVMRLAMNEAHIFSVESVWKYLDSKSCTQMWKADTGA